MDGFPNNMNGVGGRELESLIMFRGFEMMTGEDDNRERINFFGEGDEENEFYGEDERRR